MDVKYLDVEWKFTHNKKIHRKRAMTYTETSQLINHLMRINAIKIKWHGYNGKHIEYIKIS